MTTALAIQQPAGLPSVYDRIQDPLAFIDTMGKVFWQAKAAGCQTEAEGKLLALACLSERMNPFDINKTYHLMEGKLSMRADAMLAHFRKIGGTFKWIKSGDDGISSSIELTYAGQTITSTYTIEQAKQAGLVKDRGNWVKDPGSMLQARAISRGIRMVAPEVIAGTYTPEEISDFSESNSAPVVTAKSSRKSPAKETASPVEEDVIDVESVPATSTAQSSVSATVASKPTETAASQPTTKEEPPFTPDDEVKAATKSEATAQQAETTTTTPASDVTMLLIDIDFAAKEAGQTFESLEATLQKTRPGLKIAELPADKLKNLLANLKAGIEKARKEAAGK